MNKKANFFGILLSLLMFVSLFALFTAKPETTGLVVKEIQQTKEDIVVIKANEISQFCVGNIPNSRCSNTKPLYCDNGNLIYNCVECGCNEGMSCSDFGVCEILQKCADGSLYGECGFLKGKFCQEGKLIDFCDLCGCDEGEVCTNNKCVREKQNT